MVKKILTVILVLTTCFSLSACAMSPSEYSERYGSSTKRNNSSVEKIEASDPEYEEIRIKVSEAVESGLRDKYGHELKVDKVIFPSKPAGIYDCIVSTLDDKSFFHAYAVENVNGEFVMTSDEYYAFWIKDDLEAFIRPLIEESFKDEFKVFLNGAYVGDFFPYYLTPESSFDEVLEYLKKEYNPQNFTVIMKPSVAEKYDIDAELYKIAERMVEKNFRGNVGIVIYEEEDVYDKINGIADHHYYWARGVTFPSTYYSVTVNPSYEIV